MAINRHETTLEYTNTLLYSVAPPTSAEIFSYGNGSKFTIGEGATVQELLEKAGFDNPNLLVNYGRPGVVTNGFELSYPIYLNDKSAKAIKTIINQRPKGPQISQGPQGSQRSQRPQGPQISQGLGLVSFYQQHIPIVEGKITITIRSDWR